MSHKSHRYAVIIPITIDDLSGDLTVEEIKSVVAQEIMNNIEQHGQNMVILENDGDEDV